MHRTKHRSVAPIVAVCTLAVCVGCSLGFVPGYLGTVLADELDLSRSQLGLLISIFFGGTGIGSMLMGRYASAIGARALVVTDLAIVTLSYVAIGLFSSYTMFVVAAFASGFGYALTNIGSNIAIAAVSPPGRIALAMGIRTAAVPLMATLMAVTAPAAAQLFGYRTVCLTLAIISLTALTAAVAVLPAVRGDRTRTAPREKLPAAFLLVPLAAFLVVAGSQPLLSWTVTYAQEVTPYGFGAIGMSSGIGTGVGAAVLVFVARRSDQLGPSSRAAFGAIGCSSALAGTVIVWIGTPVSLALLVVGAVIGMSGMLVATGLTHAIVVDRAPNSVGLASARTMTGFYAGALVAPFLFGAIADGSGGYTAAWALSASTLALAVACFLKVQRGS